MGQTEVSKKFLSPITDSIMNNKNSRTCSDFTDTHFIHMGIQRVLGEDKSGRAFLQRSILEDSSDIEASCFYKSLGSNRRLAHLQTITDLLNCEFEKELSSSDRLSLFNELKNFSVFASDGSYFEWACHDETFVRNKSSKNESEKVAERIENYKSTKRSVQNIFSINLRNYLAYHLAVAEIGGDRKREHDIHILKRLDKDSLRMNSKKGSKVLHVYDRASIDYMQWFKWRHNGIYFLSREKSSGALQIIGTPAFDSNDPVNKGVLRNEMVGTSNSEDFRRVVYQCPTTNEIFSFVTTLPHTIRPGVIAMLYLMRWEIEKLFDEIKNKLEEKKSWATSNIAKEMQAKFICLTHNLSLIMYKNVEKEEGVVYEYDLKRKKENLKNRQQELIKRGKEFTNTWETTLRVSQITIKFFRWLRAYVTRATSWASAIQKLKLIFEQY
jgi:hypothetical protein